MTQAYHEGRPIIRTTGKGRNALILMLCPCGHFVNLIPAKHYPHSKFEADCGDPDFTVRCYGTLSEGAQS